MRSGECRAETFSRGGANLQEGILVARPRVIPNKHRLNLNAMRNPNSKCHGTLTARSDESLARAVIKAVSREFTRPSDLIRRVVAALGDCSFFFIDCFDRIVSQFLQLCQEYSSTAFDSLSCLVKNLVSACGHDGYFSRGRFCFCQGGFCQCADAIKDLPGVEPAFTRELLPVPSIEVARFFVTFSQTSPHMRSYIGAIDAPFPRMMIA
jgi:hypothetical protein